MVNRYMSIPAFFAVLVFFATAVLVTNNCSVIKPIDDEEALLIIEDAKILYAEAIQLGTEIKAAILEMASAELPTKEEWQAFIALLKKNGERLEEIARVDIPALYHRAESILEGADAHWFYWLLEQIKKLIAEWLS